MTCWPIEEILGSGRLSSPSFSQQDNYVVMVSV